MKPISAVFALILISLPCVAGQNRWSSAGPGVGVVSRIVIDPADPNVVFSITAGGIFSTTNKGQSWQLAIEGLPQTAVSNPWDSSIQSLIGGFAIGADRTLYVGIGNRVFASTDQGRLWRFRAKLPSVSIQSLAYEPRTNVLFAATTGFTGIYTSNDGGRSWQTPASLPVTLTNGVDRIAVSATAAYAVGRNATLRSTDGGRTWTSTTFTASNLFADPSTTWLYRVESSDNTVMRSEDEGSTWLALPSLQGALLTAGIASGTSLFVAMNNTVSVYEDGATSWKQIGSPASTAYVRELAVSPSAPRQIYAAPASGGISFVDGNAGDWTRRNNGLPGVNSLDVDTTAGSPSTAYAATLDGVFHTSDRGQTWTSVLTPSGPYSVAPQVVANPTSADTACVIVKGDNAGIMKTTDSGQTWKSVVRGYAFRMAGSSSDPKTLYALLSNGLASSINGGDDWKYIASDIAFAYNDFYYSTFFSMTVDPSSSSSLYLADYSGIFHSTDGGTKFKQVSKQSLIQSPLVDPSNPSTIFGAARGVIRSDDGGANWKSVGLVDKNVTTIAINGTTLYAGTDDGRLYRGINRGESWIGFDNGLLGPVSRVVVDASGNHLYASTAAGVYAYDIVNDGIAPTALGDASVALDAANAFVVPVAGSVRGFAASYTTELTLTNADASARDIVISWIPQAGDGGVKSFRLTLPPASTIKFTDAAAALGASGLATLVVAPVDETAAITASTRIWRSTTDLHAPTAQSIPSVSSALLTAHAAAHASDLEQDSAFRSNIGVVNLSGDTHQFTIQITGQHASGQLTIAVPPFALVQVPVPDGNYGTMQVDVFADSGARWLFYGSVIDRTTGEAQTIVGDAGDA